MAMDKKLRVLMVIGGSVKVVQASNTAGVWAWRQVDSLRSLGVEVETYAFVNRRSLRGLLIGGLEMRRKAQQLKSDIIHVQYGAAQALVAVLFCSQPVVLKFGGSDLLGNYDAKGRKTWSGRLSVLLSRLAAIRADRNIAVSEELRKALKLPSSQRKCEVIPDGIDLNLFKPFSKKEARNALGWLHDDPVILFMNRNGAWVKNPNLAYAAYEKAKKMWPALRIQIVETEPPERMPLFMNAADLLLITSRHEGSNNTVKEALACNLPVVATPAGDIHQRLAGVQPSAVVDPAPTIIADSIVEILQQGKRSNGREYVTQLSLDNIAKRVLKVYRETLCV